MAALDVGCPILSELKSDLERIGDVKDGIVLDAEAITASLSKTLESSFRHGLIRDSRGKSDFFDVVLALFEQQNTLGSKAFHL